MTCAIVLAAGRGERLGGVAKALLPHGPHTFLSAILATARAAGVTHAIVVVGPPFADAVTAAARALDAEVVVNPDPARGMASSVALGFASCGARYRDCLLWPVDHPFVRPETVRQVLEVRDADIVVPRYGGRGGHPVAVGPAVWPALAACPDAGARAVLADPRYARVDLAVDDPGVVRDVDTPEALPS